MKSDRELIQEANEAIGRGFNSIDQTWRKYAKIKEVSTFATESQSIEGIRFDTIGRPELATYAKLIQFSCSEVESGGHIRGLINLGRGAALKFNQVFWGEVEKRGGPSWHGLPSAKADGNLDDRMAGLVVEASFLNGQVSPRVDAVRIDGDHVEYRGYMDCGVTAYRLSSKPMEPATIAKPDRPIVVKCTIVEKSRYEWGPPLPDYIVKLHDRTPQ